MYRELRPPPELRSRLVCVWSSEPRPAAVREPRLVVPDGCTDIMWIDGRLLVAGPDDQPVEVADEPIDTVVAVRFGSGRSSSVFGVPLPAMRNQRVALAELWPEASRLEDALASSATDRDRHDVLIGAVAERIRRVEPVDPIVAEATAVLACSRPGIRELADRLGVSERHLRRRLTDELGYGPTTFARIMRFQAALTRLRDRPASIAEVAAATGYADQAHLTREVRALAGRTPREIVADAFKADAFKTTSRSRRSVRAHGDPLRRRLRPDRR